ncbi:Uncharacterised protein [uncultured archaeon]|nr:Uncharacterised protein [uncultured archaeon]
MKFSGKMPLIFTAALFIFLLLEPGSHAFPVIYNLSVENPFAWFGQINTIFLNCTDNNSTLAPNISAYADIFTPNATFLNNTFLQDENKTYYLPIQVLQFWNSNSSGLMNITAHCTNELGETANASAMFVVLNQTFRETRTVNVSINATDDGRIGYFNYPTEITQYSRMNIIMEFINTGSITYSKKTRMEIGMYDANFTILANRTGLTNTIMAGGRSVETLRYTPMIYGYLWIHIIVSFNNKTADAWGYFHVKPYYSVVPGDGTPPPPPPPVVGGGGGGSEGRIWTIQLPDITPTPAPGSKKEADSGVKEMTLTYPDKIFITPGESSVAYLIVNNKGTMPLREVTVLPKMAGGIRIDVQPIMIDVLPGNSSAIYLITLDASSDVPSGIYPLDFIVSTDKISQGGHIDVEVGRTSVDDTLERTINNYQYIIVQLENEVDSLNIEGKDTTTVTLYIEQAKNTLTLAKKAYGAKDYETTRDSLKKTRNHLVNAVIALALAKGEGVIVVMAPTIWLLIALIMIIAIAAVALYMHKRNEFKINVREEEE